MCTVDGTPRSYRSGLFVFVVETTQGVSETRQKRANRDARKEYSVGCTNANSAEGEAAVRRSSGTVKADLHQTNECSFYPLSVKFY